MNASPTGSRLRLRAGLLVSAVCLGGVAWWASRQNAPRLPSTRSEILALVGAIAVYALATALRSERWLMLLRDAGGTPQRGDCYALMAVGYMGNTVLPARAGDVMRIYLLPAGSATGRRTVLGTLVAERVLDVVALVTLFVVLAYGILHQAAGGGERAALAGGIVAAAAAAAVVLFRLAPRSRRLTRVGDFLAPVFESTRRVAGRHGVSLVGLTLGLWLVEGMSWYLAGVAAGAGLSPLDAAYLLSLAAVFSLVPSGPGYLGTLDAAVVVGMKGLGHGAAAVSYLLVLRFVLFIPITLAGLVLVVLRYGGWARSRAAGAAG